MGCGVLGLFTMILTVLIFYFRSEIISYQSEDEFIRHFEYNTKISYPHSGKIIERKHSEYLNFSGDYEYAAIIETDTFDYTRILHDVESNSNYESDSLAHKEKTTPSVLLEKKIPAGEFDYVYKMREKTDCYLWFHESKRIIVYEYIKY